MNETEAIPKSWTCTKCGNRYQFGFYVMAHWDDLLKHACDCGVKHSTRRGRVWNTRTKEPAKTHLEAA